MQIARALVLAGRRADDREWPSVAPGPKPLVPVANRPILFHSLEGLRRAGVRDVLMAVDPQTGPAIRAAVGDGADWGLFVRYAECSDASGLSATLRAVRDFAGDQVVLVQHADSLMQDDVGAHVQRAGDDALDLLALRLDGTGRARLETPLDGAWVLSPRARAILGESRATDEDPVAVAGEHGASIDVQYVDGCRPCNGDQDSLLDGNRRVLEGLRRSVVPDALERSLIRGPAIIGAGTRIVDAYVGPYTSIGANVVVEGAEIEHSIVLSGAELRFIGTRLEASVIGEGARVTRRFHTPNALRLSIGAGADVALS